MKTRISATTAETIGAMAISMGKTGALPRTEANAAAAVLRDAAKGQKPESEAGRRAAKLLTTAQVAERLTCSKRTVERMADEGGLTRRYLRPGNAKSLRFSEAQVEALCTGMPGVGESL